MKNKRRYEQAVNLLEEFQEAVTELAWAEESQPDDSEFVANAKEKVRTLKMELHHEFE